MKGGVNLNRRSSVSHTALGLMILPMEKGLMNFGVSFFDSTNNVSSLADRQTHWPTRYMGGRERCWFAEVSSIQRCVEALAQAQVLRHRWVKARAVRWDNTGTGLITGGFFHLLRDILGQGGAMSIGLANSLPSFWNWVE